MKELIAFLVIMALSLSLVAIATPDSNTSPEYTVDRIEIGAEGEEWVVLEVYDPNTDTIDHIDIKVEEGYKVIP